MLEDGTISPSLDAALRPALEELLALFDCDRAWLLHPCDPQAEQWRIPVEVTRPDWSGARAEGAAEPVTEAYRRLFTTALERTGPVCRGEGLELPLPELIRGHYGVRSSMVLAVRPATGAPWLLGIHHCRRADGYDRDARELFSRIGARIAATLERELLLARLQEREAALRERQRQLEELAAAGRLLNRSLIAADILQELVPCALRLTRARAGAARRGRWCSGNT